jgi:hypothetical protein
MKLLPPQDLAVPVPGSAIDQVAQAVTAWRQAYRPSELGLLVFGLIVFAAPQSVGAPAPSEQDKPTLSLAHIVLPLSLIRW